MVHNYQKVAVVSAVMICVFWMCLKWIQSTPLPDQGDGVATEYESPFYHNSEDKVVDHIEETDRMPFPHKDSPPFKDITPDKKSQQELEHANSNEC